MEQVKVWWWMIDDGSGVVFTCARSGRLSTRTPEEPASEFPFIFMRVSHNHIQWANHSSGTNCVALWTLYLMTIAPQMYLLHMKFRESLPWVFQILVMTFKVGYQHIKWYRQPFIHLYIYWVSFKGAIQFWWQELWSCKYAYIQMS